MQELNHRHFRTRKNTHRIQKGGTGMPRFNKGGIPALAVRGNAGTSQKDEADDYSGFRHFMSCSATAVALTAL